MTEAPLLAGGEGGGKASLLSPREREEGKYSSKSQLAVLVVYC